MITREMMMIFSIICVKLHVEGAGEVCRDRMEGHSMLMGMA